MCTCTNTDFCRAVLGFGCGLRGVVIYGNQDMFFLILDT